MAGAIALSVASGVAAALLCAWGCRAIIARAERWNIVDRPGGRKHHARPTPTAGGLAFWPAMIALPAAAAIVASMWGEPLGKRQAIGHSADGLFDVAAELSGSAGSESRFDAAAELSGSAGSESAACEIRQILLVACVATGLMLLGLWDDLRGLPWPLRLTVETVAAVATVIAGFSLRHLPCPSGESHFVGLLLDGLSVLWIVGLVNSLNMLDNMDGLAGGVGLAIAAGLVGCGWGWSAGSPGPWTVFFLPAMVGTTAGFLYFNKPPARLFMGDAGSYPLGYLLAVFGLTMPSHCSLDTQGTLLGLLCLFAVPLYDTASVVVLRIRAGASPFHPDHRHLSHRLAVLGLSPGRVSATIASLAAAAGIPAVMMPFAPAVGSAAAAAVLVGFFLLLPAGEIFAHRARRMRRE